ncbi:MAG: hypothetical protein MZU79_07205 [Anaerotruncus sp.]|nr:hypothetical protein [Anaerotruncus sp.]
MPNGGRPALAVLPFVNGTGDDGPRTTSANPSPDHLIRDLQRSAEHLKVLQLRRRRRRRAQASDSSRGRRSRPTTWPPSASVTGARLAPRRLPGPAPARSSASTTSSARPRPPRPLMTDHVPGTEAEMPVIEDRVGRRRPPGLRRPDRGRAATPSWPARSRRRASTSRPGPSSASTLLSLAPADLEKIIGLFDQAREADPGCALAYLGLGDAYQYRFVYEGRDPDSPAPDERELPARLRDGPRTGPRPTSASPGSQYFRREDTDQAYAYLKKAMELDPVEPLRPDRRRARSCRASASWSGASSISPGSSRPAARRPTSSGSGPGPTSRWASTSRPWPITTG